VVLLFIDMIFFYNGNIRYIKNFTNIPIIVKLLSIFFNHPIFWVLKKIFQSN